MFSTLHVSLFTNNQNDGKSRVPQISDEQILTGIITATFGNGKILGVDKNVADRKANEESEQSIARLITFEGSGGSLLKSSEKVR